MMNYNGMPISNITKASRMIPEVKRKTVAKVKAEPEIKTAPVEISKKGITINLIGFGDTTKGVNPELDRAVERVYTLINKNDTLMQEIEKGIKIEIEFKRHLSQNLNSASKNKKSTSVTQTISFSNKKKTFWSNTTEPTKGVDIDELFAATINGIKKKYISSTRNGKYSPKRENVRDIHNDEATVVKSKLNSSSVEASDKPEVNTKTICEITPTALLVAAIAEGDKMPVKKLKADIKAIKANVEERKKAAIADMNEKIEKYENNILYGTSFKGLDAIADMSKSEIIEIVRGLVDTIDRHKEVIIRSEKANAKKAITEEYEEKLLKIIAGQE